MTYQTIDYKLKTVGDDLCTPLGKSKIFPVEEPISDDDAVNFVNVQLKVYTEPSMSQLAAKSPELNLLDQNGDIVSDNHGHFYIFVNGHLWREVTALTGGLLAEVDLVQNFGKNQRLYCSIPFTGCLTPKRTIGLNSDSDDLIDAEVHIAYSPIQWSWQYIMSLGGLHKNDPRLKLVPKPELCQNINKAKELLNARCQKIDLDDAKANKVVYVQDPLGIAFNLLNKCQMNYIAVQSENQKIAEKPHFSSGVLAYQSMFNDELQATTEVNDYYFPTKYSLQPIAIKKTVPKDRSSAAKFLRSGAKNIDKSFLEEYLSSDELEINLHELPENQQHLFDFLADSPKESSSKPNEYITLEHALKDFATLEGIDYLLGFKWLGDIFNIMSLDADSIGTFRPWKAQLASETTRLQNEKKAKKSALTFLTNALTNTHWLTDYFTPNLGLYDLRIAGHSPKMAPELNDGSGLFRFEMFQETHAKIHKEKHADEHVLANKAFKSYLGAANSTVGYITGAWGRLSNSGGLEPHTIKIRNLMVLTNKATGIADFSDIHVANASAVIGDSATVVGISNYKRVQQNRSQRRARAKHATKNPPANAVTITNAKGEVLAAHNPKDFATNKGTMVDANWVDYNKIMGNYELLDGEILVVPKAHRYAYAYTNPEFKLGFTDTVKLNGLKALERGLPQVMLAFEVFNASQMLAKFKAGEKFDNKFKLEVANTVFTLAAGSLEITAVYSSNISKLSSANILKPFSKYLTLRAGTVIAGVGIILGGALSLMDSAKAAKSQDMDAAFLHASAAVISIAGFLYLGAALVTTPLGWAIIVIGLLITLLAVAFTDNSIETWAINGPFSRRASARCTGDYAIWQTYPLECYAALRNELFAPSMALSLQKLGKQGGLLNIEVITPGFIIGQSEVIIKLFKTTDEGMFSFEDTGEIPRDNWRITQNMNTDSIDNSPNNAQLIGDPQITGFTYSIPIMPTLAWGDDLDVEWQAKLQYALDSQTMLPYTNKAEREAWNKNDMPDKAWLIKDIEYEK